MSTPYQYPTDITDAQWQQLRHCQRVGGVVVVRGVRRVICV